MRTRFITRSFHAQRVALTILAGLGFSIEDLRADVVVYRTTENCRIIGQGSDKDVRAKGYFIYDEEGRVRTLSTGRLYGTNIFWAGAETNVHAFHVQGQGQKGYTLFARDAGETATTAVAYGITSAIQTRPDRQLALPTTIRGKSQVLLAGARSEPGMLAVTALTGVFSQRDTLAANATNAPIDAVLEQYRATLVSQGFLEAPALGGAEFGGLAGITNSYNYFITNYYSLTFVTNFFQQSPLTPADLPWAYPASNPSNFLTSEALMDWLADSPAHPYATEFLGQLNGLQVLDWTNAPVISARRDAFDAVSARDPGLLHVRSGAHAGYWMWYSGAAVTDGQVHWQVCLAGSADRTNWVKYGVVVPASQIPGSWRSHSTFSPAPYYHAASDRLYLFVSGGPSRDAVGGPQPIYTGLFATTNADWASPASYQAQFGDVPFLTNNFAWEGQRASKGFFAPSAPVLAGGRYTMAYASGSADGSDRWVGFLTSGALAGPWTKVSGAGPGLDLAPGRQADEPWLLPLRGGGWLGTIDSRAGHLGFIVSTNQYGTNGWQFYQDGPGMDANTWHVNGVGSSSVIQEADGSLLIAYSGNTAADAPGSTSSSIGLATATLNPMANTPVAIDISDLAQRLNMPEPLFAGGQFSVEGGGFEPNAHDNPVPTYLTNAPGLGSAVGRTALAIPTVSGSGGDFTLQNPAVTGSTAIGPYGTPWRQGSSLPTWEMRFLVSARSTNLLQLLHLRPDNSTEPINASIRLANSSSTNQLLTYTYNHSIYDPALTQPVETFRLRRYGNDAATAGVVWLLGVRLSFIGDHLWAVENQTNVLMHAGWEGENPYQTNFVFTLPSIRTGLEYASNGMARKCPEFQPTPWRAIDLSWGVNEARTVELVQRMKTNGLLAAGWNWLFIGDNAPGLPAAWGATYRLNGHITWDTNNYPHGIPWLVNFAHTNGFRLMIDYYVIPPDRPQYAQQDLTDIASWGVDGVWPDITSVDNALISAEYVQAFPRIVHQAFSTARTRLSSGLANPCFMLWFSPTLADWRAGQESGRIVEVFFPRELADEVNAISFMCADNVGLLNQRLSEAHAAMNYAWAWGRGTYPFGWANYDQDPGKIREALNIMAMMNMPILSACVIRSDGSYVSDMWTNREVLAIFDDPLAIPAHSAFSNSLAEIWVRPLQAPGCGSNAVCFVNGGPPDGPSVTLTLTAQMLGLASNAPVQLYDPWGHTNVAIFTNAYTYSITSSNVNMFTAWPANPSLSIPAPSATPPINPSQIKAWLDVKLPNGEILKTPLYE